MSNEANSSLRVSLHKLWLLLGGAERRRLALLAVILLFAAMIEVVGVGMVPVVVGAISAPDQVMQSSFIGSMVAWLPVDNTRTLLAFALCGLLAVFVLKTCYRLYATWMQARLLQDLRVRLSSRLFRAYMHAPYAFHLTRNPADLMRNANQEVEQVVLYVISPILTMLGSTLVGLAVVIFMLTVQPWVTLIGLGFFGGASGLYLRVVRDRALKLGIQAQDHRAGSIKAVNQGLGGIKEARVMGREDFFVAAYNNSMSKLAESYRHQFVTGEMIGPSLELVAVVGLAAIVAVLIGTGVIVEDIVPVLALFAAALLRLKQAVWQFATTVNSLRYQHVSVNPVYDDIQALAATEAGVENTGTTERRPTPFTRDITLRDVVYRYSAGSRDALRGINLTIPRGASVGLVGATGAGKSTLADILLGLLAPTSGIVAVDGRDVRDDLRGWQANLGYIPQSLYLIDDTLRRNIALGLNDDEIDDARIRESVRIAQLDDVIAELPDGLDTLLGDRGIRFSGGQRQRVCIARALYHNPSILVLDEATSALDNLTEQRIVQELEERRGDRTLIVIAHRLSTVMDCDCLFLMRNGRLEASGTFQELMDNNAHFRELAANGQNDA